MEKKLEEKADKHIMVKLSTKNKLDETKIIPRETYDSVILRLLRVKD